MKAKYFFYGVGSLVVITAILSQVLIIKMLLDERKLIHANAIKVCEMNTELIRNNKDLNGDLAEAIEIANVISDDYKRLVTSTPGGKEIFGLDSNEVEELDDQEDANTGGD